MVARGTESKEGEAGETRGVVWRVGKSKRQLLLCSSQHMNRRLQAVLGLTEAVDCVEQRLLEHFQNFYKRHFFKN